MLKALLFYICSCHSMQKLVFLLSFCKSRWSNRISPEVIGVYWSIYRLSVVGDKACSINAHLWRHLLRHLLCTIMFYLSNTTLIIYPILCYYIFSPIHVHPYTHWLYADLSNGIFTSLDTWQFVYNRKLQYPIPCHAKCHTWYTAHSSENLSFEVLNGATS